jgi:hypothetical protein
VLLFALLHDSQRLHDGDDPDHGRRAARLVADIDRRYVSISERQRNLLEEACRFTPTSSSPLTQRSAFAGTPIARYSNKFRSFCSGLLQQAKDPFTVELCKSLITIGLLLKGYLAL